MAGMFNVIFGLTAIFEDETLSRVGGTVIVWDLTAWGWIHLLLGVLMILTAAGLFGGQDWARWTAVFFAGRESLSRNRPGRARAASRE
jgi:hypothetical protein